MRTQMIRGNGYIHEVALTTAVFTLLFFGSPRLVRSQQAAQARPSIIPALTDPKFKEPFIDVDEWRDKLC